MYLEGQQRALWYFWKKAYWLKANQYSSSETHGQIVGARESLNGRKNMARRKVKKRREEPLGTMSYQTSSQRSPPFWLLIGARKLLCFSGLYRELWRHRERLAYPRLQNSSYFPVDSPIHLLNNWNQDCARRERLGTNLSQGCFQKWKYTGWTELTFRKKREWQQTGKQLLQKGRAILLWLYRTAHKENDMVLLIR